MQVLSAQRGFEYLELTFAYFFGIGLHPIKLRLNQQFALFRLSCSNCCMLSHMLPLDQMVVSLAYINFRILYRKWQIIYVH